jgi:hypothetical protein
MAQNRLSYVPESLDWNLGEDTQPASNPLLKIPRQDTELCQDIFLQRRYPRKDWVESNIERKSASQLYRPSNRRFSQS